MLVERSNCYQIPEFVFGEHMMESFAEKVKFGGGGCFDLVGGDGKRRWILGEAPKP